MSDETTAAEPRTLETEPRRGGSGMSAEFAVTAAPARGNTRMIARLPKIVRFLESTYAPDSSCPHCGARGATIHRFTVEDGRVLGAMSGCVKLFPVSRVAAIDLQLRKKEHDAAKRGHRVASWNRRLREVITAFYNGQADEHAVVYEAELAASSARAWMRRRR